MAGYQVIARRFRPQKFSEVVGQEAVVTTLKNALKENRLAHAYLFSGPRGTGKTTTARILAKAVNCKEKKADGEPCCCCTSCLEIAEGRSLDVLEIDGASHRGIEDIRKINDTAGYAASSGGYKIYIIDEVHMLTKEAFNALLKTLEEPPSHVLFFFATTEPHKVLPTILSRCQRFRLSPIRTEQIAEKLSAISRNLELQVEDEALLKIATLAEGGLRDAESLLDQVISFQNGSITSASVTEALGTFDDETLFTLHPSIREERVADAFTVANELYQSGKDLHHFIEVMLDHFRDILLSKISEETLPEFLSPEKKKRLKEASALYTPEQLMTVLDWLIEAEKEIRTAPSPKIFIEALLLRLFRVRKLVPLDLVLRRLDEMERKAPQKEPLPPPPAKEEKKPELTKSTPHYETVMQFAAVELEGKLEK